MKYHFIGDQGISMRGLKEYMSLQGHEVSGSDLKTGGHKAENITPDIDVVVRTSAVSPGSPGWIEVEAAQKLGIKVIKRSQLLGEISRDKKLIAISGMHGKTTVTSMVGLLLIEAGFDPTVIVGEVLKEFGDDVIRIGHSEWFVMEACEYDRSFLDFSPQILILTNIEEEHLDTYPGGLPEIKETFLQYCNRLPDDGVIIACYEDKNVREIMAKTTSKAKKIFYGFSADTFSSLGFELQVPGKHNILNALSVVALADYLGINKDITQKVLENYNGAKRRFEYKGVVKGAKVYDDYGHHPTEIRATLEGLASKFPDKKKVVIFWPHQYKRIKPLLADFGHAFEQADEVVLKPIFFVPGRDEMLDVKSEDIAEIINSKAESGKRNVEGGRKARVVKDDAEIVKYLHDIADDKTVILTIGIPPVYKIAEELVNHPHLSSQTGA